MTLPDQAATAPGPHRADRRRLLGITAGAAGAGWLLLRAQPARAVSATDTLDTVKRRWAAAHTRQDTRRSLAISRSTAANPADKFRHGAGGGGRCACSTALR